jgi:hypothetical protein
MKDEIAAAVAASKFDEVIVLSVPGLAATAVFAVAVATFLFDFFVSTVAELNVDFRFLLDFDAFFCTV